MHIPPNWTNPTPTLTDTGLDPEALARLADKRQLLFSLPPRDIRVPVRGEMRLYKSAVFRGSALVLPVPAEHLRRHLRDFASYASHVPNTETVVVKASRGAHAEVEYRHVFRLSMITLATRILLQHVQEPDDSQSAWLVEGDADAALSRWQVYALDAQRSLVVFFNWADIASINVVISMLLKAQPDMAVAAPYGAAFVAMEALRRAYMPDEAAPVSGLQLLELPLIPAFPSVQKHPVLAKLAAAGPVAFVDAGQWLCREGKILRQRFVAVGAVAETAVDQAFRHSLRFDQYTEFFPLVQKAQCKPRGEGFSVDWNVGIGLGFFFVGVHYRLAYLQTAANTLRFLREDGDLAHIDGEWHWQALNEDASLGALTISNHIGEQPPLVLRFAQQYPYHDILAGLYMGLVGLPRMARWMACQEPLPSGSDGPVPGALATATISSRSSRRVH